MILENDLKIHVFLAAVELALAAAVASWFKDPAQHLREKLSLKFTNSQTKSMKRVATLPKRIK